MEKEILSEWVLDCHGRKDLDYNLLVLVLFRVVHSWAVHIDYEEYAFLLHTIYRRLIRVVKVRTKERIPVLPNIVVTFPDEERKLKNAANQGDEEDAGAEGAEWIECDEDESPRSDFEYKYGDENDTMDLKRYKRPKNLGGAGILSVTHIKDPFLYQELVEFDLEGLEEGTTIVEQLIEEEYVIPLGYPTEQYFFKLKNDVHDVLSQHKEKNKSYDDDLKDFNDPGDLKAEGKKVEQTFFLFSNNGFYKEYKFLARLTDTLYNKFRFAFRE